jgi:hypothetical protein
MENSYWRRPLNRDQILDNAKQLINGDRAKDYGDAYFTHDRIAKGWNVIALGAIESHGEITAAHVASDDGLVENLPSYHYNQSRRLVDG